MIQSRIPKVGDKVNVVQKKDYETGKLTIGVVREVLTKDNLHPRGHKVRLENGIIGRVVSFVEEEGKTEKPFFVDPDELR